MVKNENISKRIWAFLDGDVSVEEKAEIQHLISSNDDWKTEFEASKFVHDSLGEMTEEQPSMRFVKNVLDKLPVPRHSFIQPKGLLSFKAKIAALVVFVASLAIGLVDYLPSFKSSRHSFIYKSIEDELYTFIRLFSFKLEVTPSMIIISSLLVVLAMDHFLFQIYSNKAE